MEFLIELAGVTAGIWLVVVGLSIGVLYPSKLYKTKRATIITPVILAFVIGAIGPENHKSLGQWAYYVLPTLILAPLFVSGRCYKKRLKDKGYQSSSTT